MSRSGRRASKCIVTVEFRQVAVTLESLLP